MKLHDVNAILQNISHHPAFPFDENYSTVEELTMTNKFAKLTIDGVEINVKLYLISQADSEKQLKEFRKFLDDNKGENHGKT